MEVGLGGGVGPGRGGGSGLGGFSGRGGGSGLNFFISLMARFSYLFIELHLPIELGHLEILRLIYQVGQHNLHYAF